MPAPNGFRGVLFDWDGTLVDSAQRTYRCYVRVFSAYGIGYDHAAFGWTDHGWRGGPLRGHLREARVHAGEARFQRRILFLLGG